MRGIFLIAGLLVGMDGIAWAHVGERVIPIYQLSDEDLAQIDLKDGSTEDWENILGEPSLTTLDFGINFNIGDGVTYDPSDLDFRIWLGWNQSTSRIYVAMEAADNVYVNQFRGRKVDGIHNGSDNIALRIDGDHSGGKYQFFREEFDTKEEWYLAFQAQAQAYYIGAQAPDNSYITHSLAHAEWTILPPYAEGGGEVFSEAPVISVTEFFLTPFDRLVWNSPEESVPSRLFPGKIVGLGIDVPDVDTPRQDPSRISSDDIHALYSLPLVYDPPFTADLLVDGVLVGLDGKVPAISAVESDSWARIKASLGR